MNILILDHFDCHGGAQEYAIDLAGQLNTTGHTCYLSKISLPTLLEKAKELPLLRSAVFPNTPLSFFRDTWSLKKEIADKRIDLLHCNSLPSLIIGKLVRKNQPIVFAAHDSHLSQIKKFLIRTCSDYIISVSKSVKDDCIASKITQPNQVIYNGLFDFKVEKRTQNETIVAVPGRIKRKKGIDIFVDAALKLEKEFPNTQFQIIGNSDEPEYLEELRKQIGKSSQITFRSFCNSKEELYSSVDIIVNSSRYIEPLGRTLIEAGIASLPVLGPNRGGPTEIIEDGVSGFLFESGNSDDLAEKLSKLLSSDSLRSQMGAEGRRIFDEKFRINRITEQIVLLYESALNTRKV